MQRRRLLLGPPGTGKTTRLLHEVEQALTRGVPSNQIAFVSFTRAAIREAKDRACSQFNLTYDDLPLFRTLHSLAYHLLSLRRGDVFGKEALTELSETTNEELTGKLEIDAPTLGERGDALLFLDQYARNVMIPIDQAWQAHGTPLDWFRLKRFVDAYGAMRQASGLVDFTGMIEQAVSRNVTVDASLALIDESQDITPLQWRFVESAFRDVPEMIISGDDDQGIYAWAGASSEALLAFDGEKEVLSQSYRLPRAVWDVAASVAKGIGRRYVKDFSPAVDDAGGVREGSVEWLSRPDEVDLTFPGSWLLVARTRRQLGKLADLARDQGVVYSLAGKSSVDPAHVAEIVDYERYRGGDPDVPLWHDGITSIPLESREYYLSCLRRDRRALSDPPRVRVDTIHGVKGLEADRVLLMTDLNARIRRGMDLDPDAEARVWYVGVTRAREALYPVVAQSGRGYPV